MWKIFLPFAVLIAVLLTASLVDSPRPRADFSFINRGDVSTLDLQRMSWMQDLRVARLLFEGLVRNDIFTPGYEKRPAVAERWDISDDGRTYTFHLRTNARWSCGEPVRAGDFVYAWRRALLPDTASDYTAQFQLIQGGPEFFAWRERALAGMLLRGALQQLPSGSVVPDGASTEDQARRLADVIWFFVERRPSRATGPAPADSPVSSDFARSRARIDSLLTELSHLRGSLAAPSLSADLIAQTQRQITQAQTELSQIVASLAPRHTDLRRAADQPALSGLDLWRETEQAFDALVHARALDDNTFQVTLARPTPYFLDLCAFACFYPVYPPLVRQFELPDDRTGRINFREGWTKPPQIVCNGPFVLTSWRFKRDLWLEKNQNYWNRDAIALDSIRIPTVEDPNGQVLTFNSGGVDWVSDVTPSYRADMLDAKQRFHAEHQAEYDAMVAQGLDPVEIDRRLPPDARATIHSFPAFGTYFYNFNCRPSLPDGRPNPFADARVRRAFAMAIDKKRIAGEVRRCGEPPTSILIPRGSLAGYPSPTGLPYDPPRARELLAQAGYPGGAGFITVVILFNRDSGHDVIAQAVARDWQENLGVQVVLDQREIAVVRDELKNHKFITSRAGWFGDYGDPTTFLDLNRTGDGNNDRDYSNPRYDSLLDQAAAERDPARRMDLLSQAERIIVEEDLPLIPLFHYVQVYQFDPHKLTGISSHPRQQQDLFLVDIFGDGKGSEKPKFLPPTAR